MQTIKAYENKTLRAMRGVMWCIVLLAAVLLTGICVPSIIQAYAAEGASVVLTADGAELAPSSAHVDPNADSKLKLSENADAIVYDASSFAFKDFMRQNKGTNRSTDGVYHGYQYTMAAQNAFAVINTRGATLIYIPSSVASNLGVNISSASFQANFLTMLYAIDKASSKGGTILADLDNAFYFTSQDTLVIGEYTYKFGVELNEDRYYATVTQAGSEDGSGGALYMESGLLEPRNDVAVVEAPTGVAALQTFFQKLDWSPLWVSLRTTGVAIAIIFVLGLLAAWLTLRVSDRIKGILDTIFTIPMVLPPTVCGFLLLMFFGSSTPTGQWLINHGIDIVFTWPAAVIACAVVGFPLMYRTVRGAFENLDANMLDAARTLGWKESRIFLRIMLPLAWPSIAAGTVLAFARAMGEFGCTLFFAGNYAGVTQTIPIAIYFDWMSGNTDAAIFWVIVVILISFLVILFINFYSSRTQRYKRRLEE